jgi:glutamate 5-kinase
VVVKLGTAVLTHDGGRVALGRLYAFVESLALLRREGRQVLLVSSGAVGLGAHRLGVRRERLSLIERQACAAVGQGRLMALYADAFERLGVTTAQVLLTPEDFADRRRYLNLRRTVRSLLALGVLPIVNENDTVSTAELRTHGGGAGASFGDNDGLSALVAARINAHLLLILTDVAGVHTADPGASGDAPLVELVARFTPELERSAGGPRLGRGGMRSKLDAARVASRSGCATVVANGLEPHVIDRVFAGEALGTLFVPQITSQRRGRRKVKRA